MQRKKVGIVGGLGYMSTLEYYRGIMKECQAYTNSDEFPELVITSLDITCMMGMLEKEFYEQVTWYLFRAIQDLRKARVDRVFITHSGCDEEIILAVKAQLESLEHFEEILVTRAGSVITSHCGPGTLGVLYVAGEE